MDPPFAVLKRVPTIAAGIGCNCEADGQWWAKFSIDIGHRLAWHVVQELGHVLNYVSVEEPLPTVFKPVSPSPYMNGGPREFLSWVIECHDPASPPAKCVRWLESRLPSPVDDEEAWPIEYWSGMALQRRTAYTCSHRGPSSEPPFQVARLPHSEDRSWNASSAFVASA
jgi:hypothetical protein